jgi:hypothetical protein
MALLQSVRGQLLFFLAREIPAMCIIRWERRTWSEVSGTADGFPGVADIIESV